MAQDAGDLMACPQLKSRRFFREIQHPVAGPAAYPGMGASLSELPPGGGGVSPAPLLGQHNTEIYGNALGYDADALAALRYAGVI